MINQIKDGISIKLNTVFGNSYAIYSKTVSQDLQEPCFFILSLNPSINQVIGNRYFHEIPFDVHYFPSVSGDNDELDQMGADLFGALDYITLVNADIVKGSKMRYEKIDSVLHFFVNYNLFTKQDLVPEEGMEEITFNGGLVE